MKMKRSLTFLLGFIWIVSILSGCADHDLGTDTLKAQGIQIALSDDGILVDGQPAGEDSTQSVYTAQDIIYYEDGHDFTYGEGTQNDAHTSDEAAAHTVLHITQPGQYVLSGKLSRGQIAVDLGDGAVDDPEAVVTLVLNGVDITCEVAPAVIFYQVYECGNKDTAAAGYDVDMSGAGANVIVADGSENTVRGSYVARIYRPDSVVLSEDGSEVAEAKKLHKYDGAFYSKMSMNIAGGKRGDGILDIQAENEGLCSELHLTIDGGNINILSGNDGINANEDGLSVITINDGMVAIRADGTTGEGDGIDSNGWLVINGGAVFAEACAVSGDAGIDSDMGIHIHGGTVVASGNMLDQIADSRQNFAVFQFAETQNGGLYTLKDADGKTIAEHRITNAFRSLVISNEALVEGEYQLWQNETRMQGVRQTGNAENMPPEALEGVTPFEEGEEPPKPDVHAGMLPPEGLEDAEHPGDGTQPKEPGEGAQPPTRGDGESVMPPEDMEGVPPAGGMFPGRPGINETSGSISDVFTMFQGGNYFSVVRAVEK